MTSSWSATTTIGPETCGQNETAQTAITSAGMLPPDRIPCINGFQWTSDDVLALVRDAAGDDAWLEGSQEDSRFDVLPLLVVTDGAIAAFGRDVRRLRPKLVVGGGVGGVDGVAEFDWAGMHLDIGDVVIELDSRRARCPMTTVDPDTLAVDPGVLRDIGRRFGGRLALNADVVHGGTIAVGDHIVRR